MSAGREHDAQVALPLLTASSTLQTWSHLPPPHIESAAPAIASHHTSVYDGESLNVAHGSPPGLAPAMGHPPLLPSPGAHFAAARPGLPSSAPASQAHASQLPPCPRPDAIDPPSDGHGAPRLLLVFYCSCGSPALLPMLAWLQQLPTR
jgi:hypothetical protein